jgi:hypothetical protein
MEELATIFGAIRRTRTAMSRLGASADQLEKYQLLKQEHLSITTAKIDPAERGQQNTSLAWFWTLDIQNDTDAFEGMTECEFTLFNSSVVFTAG